MKKKYICLNLPKAKEDTQRYDERYERDGVATDVQVVNQPPELRAFLVVAFVRVRREKKGKVEMETELAS